MNQMVGQKAEVEAKLKRLRERLAARQLDGVLLNLTANTAWITAGAATYVNEATDGGASSLLITHDKAYVLTDTIEGPRLRQEEKLADLGFELVVEPWYARGGRGQQLMAGQRIGREGADPDINLDLRELRTVLQPEEIARLRQLSTLAAEAMNEAVEWVRPGDTEYQLAARLAAAGRARGGSPIVNLIASDDRIYQFRHPLPTAKKVERYAMLVLCLRISGLVVSITRLVHFGPLPEELRAKAMAVARVDAKLIAGTQPGRTMADLFNLAKQAYQEEGYPEAIEEHHQGGSAGYSPREVLATPTDQTPIQRHQAFAWNPSIRGAKSEDTVLLGDSDAEVLTVVPGWPTWEVSVGNQVIQRPAILELEPDYAG